MPSVRFTFTPQAHISVTLAQEFPYVHRDEAYTFALFRDCGMPPMMVNFREYEPVFPGMKVPNDANVIEYENDEHGVNHARAGCYLAKTWLLPEEIHRAILWHHNYPAVQDDSAGLAIASSRNIALAAEAVYVKLKMGTHSAEWRKGASFALAALDITLADLDGAAQRLVAQFG